MTDHRNNDVDASVRILQYERVSRMSALRRIRVLDHIKMADLTDVELLPPALK